MTLPTWFGHLEESFSCKRKLSKIRFPSADKVDATPANGGP